MERIETPEALERQILEWGFLPFFRSAIEGFSIEDMMPEGLLYGEHGNAEESGAWQWRASIISHWQTAYGKFFGGKAGYVSLDWLPDFMNMRRDRMPVTIYSQEAINILHTLRTHESMISKDLKIACGYTLSRKRKTFNPADSFMPLENPRNATSFDSLITQLQMGTHVCIADFEYSISHEGKPYGWGVARYCTPEALYEIDYKTMVEGRTPLQSRVRILNHLRSFFPSATDRQWVRLI